jgi:hypothetical protein
LSKSVNSDNTDFSDYHSKVPEILDIAIYFWVHNNSEPRR